MTRKELSQYRSYKALLKAMEAEIEDAYNTVKSPSISNEGHSTTPSNPTEQAIKRIEKLRRQQAKVQVKVDIIDDWLENESNTMLVTICKMHYILGYSWEDTSYKLLGYYSKETIRSYTRRHLD